MEGTENGFTAGIGCECIINGCPELAIAGEGPIRIIGGLVWVGDGNIAPLMAAGTDVMGGGGIVGGITYGLRDGEDKGILALGTAAGLSEPALFVNATL
jgi:hypothetical protein